MTLVFFAELEKQQRKDGVLENFRVVARMVGVPIIHRECLLAICY